MKPTRSSIVAVHKMLCKYFFAVQKFLAWKETIHYKKNIRWQRHR
tara:strand:- start:370 stop:504 length:135 start_codon:yes stop_codon:yes gene_type:complete